MSLKKQIIGQAEKNEMRDNAGTHISATVDIHLTYVRLLIFRPVKWHRFSDTKLLNCRMFLILLSMDDTYSRPEKILTKYFRKPSCTTITTIARL